jgi:hypothetical protein
MKSFKYSIYVACMMLLASCDQEVIDLQKPDPIIDTTCEDAVSGSADFTKFITIGNSFVAGVQAGALYTDAQNNSLGAIINKQLECAGASSTFNQPSINSENGWNLFVTQPFLTDNSQPILGRLALKYSGTDCTTGAPSAKPTAQESDISALPNPAGNPGFLYTGSKASLNNFGVPAILLGQALIPETGNWTGATSDPRFSPFYGRLAYPGTGTSTLIGDAAASGGSFFLLYLGLDDFFLHAAYGGDPTAAPLTTGDNFKLQYAGAINALLNSNPDLKGVVGNFPNIFAMPHFTSVPYNPLPLDADKAQTLNGAFAGYNAAIQGLIGYAALFNINDALKAELATRLISYEASCNNPVLISDETLTDLGPYFDALMQNEIISEEQRQALAPYQQVRQSKSTDIFPLMASTVIGTLVNNNPNYINGVTIPLADKYVLLPSEVLEIETARQAYNAAINDIAADNSTRIAVADISTAFSDLITARAAVISGVTITPNINPPTGIYSEDGVHPNTRGYAFMSRIFIDAINKKFGSTIPLTNINDYSATGLPTQ